MLIIIVTLMVFGLLYPEGSGQVVGPASSSRIIGGEEALPNSWPWQLSLRVNGRHICGATLISMTWALTAAHCFTWLNQVNDPSKYNITIIAGAHKLKNDGVLYHVEKVIVHEGFNLSHFKHDFALVKLRDQVILNRKVSPIALPLRHKISRYSECFISGWGRFSNDSLDLPDVLQEAKVTVVDRKTCMKRNILHVDKGSMICVGGAGLADITGCSGDSGGPLMCKSKRSRHWVLYGIASWVISKDCPRDAYTVYARVSTHIDWIRKNTGGMIACRDKYDMCNYMIGYCRWSKVIRMNCKKSCRVCL